MRFQPRRGFLLLSVTTTWLWCFHVMHGCAAHGNANLFFRLLCSLVALAKMQTILSHGASERNARCRNSSAKRMIGTSITSSSRKCAIARRIIWRSPTGFYFKQRSSDYQNQRLTLNLRFMFFIYVLKTHALKQFFSKGQSGFHGMRGRIFCPRTRLVQGPSSAWLTNAQSTPQVAKLFGPLMCCRCCVAACLADVCPGVPKSFSFANNLLTSFHSACSGDV